MLEIIPIIVVGIICGTFTGLIPGIHTNLLAIILLSFLSFLTLSNQNAIILVVSMALTHTFIDFIPSIYLGAPDEDTALSILPGHKFLKKGLGHQAIILTLIGSTIAVISFIIIIPFFSFSIPKIFPFIQRFMALILIWISIFLISKEEQKIPAILIFILAGFLGIASLNITTNNLLPLLTGLFGSSTLIFSIKQKTKIPEQKQEKSQISKNLIKKPFLLTTLISPIFSFLPGLGSSQAAITASQLTDLTKEQFLILLGSINTFVLLISILTLKLIQKTRTGTAAAISQLTNNLNLFPIIATIIITTIISIPLTIFLSKTISKHIHKINYSKISFATLLILTTIVLILTQLNGLIIFLTSTILGLLTISLNVKRSFLMGSLLIPTILFYLPF